jgi:hypothetical protein
MGLALSAELSEGPPGGGGMEERAVQGDGVVVYALLFSHSRRQPALLLRRSPIEDHARLSPSGDVQ